jgi:uncharacterized protein YggT (Ycf19 family)
MDFIIQAAANAYIVVLLIRWLGETLLPMLSEQSWFEKIVQVTEPVLTGVRKVLPTLGGWDFSYLATIVGIHLIAKILTF